MRGGRSTLGCRIIHRVLVVGKVVRPLRACSTARVAVGALVLRMVVVPAVVIGIARRVVSPRVRLTQNTGGVDKGFLARFYVVTPSAVVEGLSAKRAKGDRSSETSGEGTPRGSVIRIALGGPHSPPAGHRLAQELTTGPPRSRPAGHRLAKELAAGAPRSPPAGPRFAQELAGPPRSATPPSVTYLSSTPSSSRLPAPRTPPWLLALLLMWLSGHPSSLHHSPSASQLRPLLVPRRA